MSFSEVIPLTAALVNLMLTLFILTRGLRSTVNRVYGVWGLSMTIWNLGTFFLFRVKDPSAAYFWACFVQVGVVTLPISNLHLCLQIAGKTANRWLVAGYLFHLLLGSSIFTGHFIAGVRDVEYAFYSIAGPGYYLFLLSYSLSGFAGILLLYKVQKSASQLHRLRIRWLMAALLLIEIFGANDILPIFGIDHYPFTDVQIYPIGSLAAIFYSILIGYSVLQHRLLDINVTLGRVAGRLVRFSFLFLMSLSLLIVVAIAFPTQFPPFAVAASLSIITVVSLVTAMLFPKLLGQGDEVLERRILGDRFQYQEKIKSFLSALTLSTKISEVIGGLERLLAVDIGLQSFAIIIRNENSASFSLQRAMPPEPAREVPGLKDDSPAIAVFAQSRVGYFALNLGYTEPGASDLDLAARQQLASFKGQLSLIIRGGETNYGLLILGEKISKDPFTPYDIELLLNLAQQTGLIINQIRLNDRLLFQEEMELMGRMSRGLAHDLNNLVTPVSTYLQLVQEQNGSADGLEELLPVALRNIQTIRAYIKEALMFSNTQSLQLTQTTLDGVVRNSASLAQAKLQPKNIRLELDLPTAVPVEIDSVLIQRVIDNLLSNAADASAASTVIKITLRQLARSEANREWHRIEVTDQGEGISKENLKRIFTPYFTTKDKGDKTRGFGLGLAICRKIVHLHGGNLSVRSELGKGTTVQLDLPSAQLAKAVAPKPQEAIA